MEEGYFRDQMWQLLQYCADGLESMFRPVYASHHLTAQQVRLLFEIRRGSACTVGQAAQQLGTNNGNTSSLCKKIESAGLISRERDGKDERVVRLSLTAAGAKTIAAVEKDLEDRYAAYLRSWPEQDLQGILDGLATLCRLMEGMQQYAGITGVDGDVLTEGKTK